MRHLPRSLMYTSCVLKSLLRSIPSLWVHTTDTVGLSYSKLSLPSAGSFPLFRDSLHQRPATILPIILYPFLNTSMLGNGCLSLCLRGNSHSSIVFQYRRCQTLQWWPFSVVRYGDLMTLFMMMEPTGIDFTRVLHTCTDSRSRIWTFMPLTF